MNISEQTYIIGDCRDVLKSYPNKFGLIITSPPYNVGKEYEEIMSEDEYSDFLLSCYRAIYDSMTENSRICVNVPFNMTNLKTDDISNIYYLNYKVLEKVGLKYRETIIWNQQNAQNGTAWGSWKSASAPWLRHQTEAILVMYKGNWNRGKGVSDITSKEFMKFVLDIWVMNCSQRDIHPCPFPTELPKRCIRLFSFVDDWILDPFLGSGTTLLACRECNRSGVGIEKSSKYENEIKRKALIGVKDVMKFE